ELALSHTGSLAGSGAVMDAFFERIGVISAGSIPVLLEALKILHVHGRLPGKTMVSMSCSGGEALLTSDIAERTSLEFRAFDTDEKTRIKATTHELVTVDNPFDYHTFDWGKWDRVVETYTEVLRCGFDMASLVLDFPRDDRCDPTDWIDATDALRKATVATGAASAVVATLHEAFPEDVAEGLMRDGIVPLFGLDEALLAVDACSEPDDAGPAPVFAGLQQEAGQAVSNLTEWEAKCRLAEVGVCVPAGELCTSQDAAIAAFERLGGPVAAKAVSPEVLHKTEQGAVRLGLEDVSSVGAAFGALAPLGDVVLIEAMAGPAVADLIVGVRRDPIVGLYLLAGSGGVTAELVRDTRIVLLPASGEAVRAALLDLQLAPLLTGYRGRPAGDIGAVVQQIMAVQDFALAHAACLEELEINPLLVHAEGSGATAVDALMRLRETT
ncbi:MAG: acetate--CoA ligase family protein, partial [Hyphomicrobiaceae bacterium]